MLETDMNSQLKTTTLGSSLSANSSRASTAFEPTERERSKKRYLRSRQKLRAKDSTPAASTACAKVSAPSNATCPFKTKKCEVRDASNALTANVNTSSTTMAREIKREAPGFIRNPPC